MKTDCVPRDVGLAFRNAYRVVKRLCPHLVSIQSRAPCTVYDVAHIVSSTPPGDRGKPEQASCWLTSVQCGARVVTMAHILLADIISVCLSSRKATDTTFLNTTLDTHTAPSYLEPSPSSSSSSKFLYLVQLCFQVTKGNWKWNHKVTFEGQMVLESSRDQVYWLQQHLLQNFHLSLLDFANWKLTPSQKLTKIWHWNEDAMSAAFKSACISSGFPAELFSFHSLRAGFICSAILSEALKDKNVDKRTQQAVMERCAWIGGWVVNGAAQQGYVKDCAKAALVTTRVVGAGPEFAGPADGDIDPILTSPQVYHSLPSAPKPSYSVNRNWEKLNDEINKIVFPDNAAYVEGATREAVRRHCLEHALQTYVKVYKKYVCVCDFFEVFKILFNKSFSLKKNIFSCLFVIGSSVNLIFSSRLELTSKIRQ